MFIRAVTRYVRSHSDRVDSCRLFENVLTYCQNYVNKNSITNGSLNRSKRCHEAQAITVFLWFGFLTFLGSLIFSALSARGGGANLRGGARKGPPAMSQA